MHGIFCPICYTKHEDIQTKFSENLFEKQIRFRYDADIADVTSPNNSRVKKLHKNGVKKPCSLNKVLNFQILENNTLDPMHIMLEGNIPFE